MKKISQFLRQIKRCFGLSKTPFQRNGRQKINKGLAYRQVLLDQIFNHFKKRFEEETTTISISFPVSFVIYLHPQDYKKREANFDRDVIDAVTLFYRHINQHIENSNYDYQPDATYWMFQFVNFQGLSSIESKYGDIAEVKEGEAVILSDIRATDFSKDNIQASGHLKTTFHAKDSSKQHEINNQSLISIIDKLSNCKLGLKYSDEDRKQGKVTGKPSIPGKSQNIVSEAYAVLHCNEKFIGRDRKGEKFLIYYKLIEISGKNDARNGAYIAKIDSDRVITSHVQIQYIPEIQKFQLAAFGTIKLNERTVQLSSGGDIHWYHLPDNSDIFIENAINVKFKIT